ncbi:MAG: TlyA family RNA methyltransferase [Bacteriovoracaceae bacterium]|nr:TlyA family RNA methyltransferase [Bacteriovoracaceae bacterium]
MDRVDKILVSLGLARSRNHAADLIEKGCVTWKGKVVSKSSQKVSIEDLIVENSGENYVGRGAYKLIGGLDHFKISPKNLICADMGASTGGFTEVLLEREATKVYAIDVGHDQLAPSLKNDPRVENLEGLNIRNGVDLPEKINLAVGDLSFISLTLLLEEIFKVLSDDGIALLLIKPQFEVGRSGLDKNGIVKNLDLHIEAISKVRDCAEDNDFSLGGLITSPIKGKTGNREYLGLFKKRSQIDSVSDDFIEKMVRSDS